ncbi:zinc finger BED domain-containing protein RICESLEEPER 2-like [Bidens hawaiensis]|uniref:zinc finger BED domain-containing protein RICESLEEPER 2-like n=1 Tax=Bidens hawaiensis TaxID=980011 RepID=UPI0040496EA4
MGSRKRKLTSIVWNHFEKMTINGEDKAECHYCKRKLGAKSENGTRHLLDHYNKFCPKRNQRDIRQQVLGMGQKTTDGQTNLTCLNFDPDKSRKDLAEMVIVHEYPLVIVEHHKFRKFVTGLQPLFKVPSRNTLKSDILKIYDFQKEKTMGILEKNQSRIAITTDMWTSGNQKKGFMSITAHLIDEKWEMQSRIMRFIYVPSPHTAEVLAEVLYQSMCDWNIDRKISTVTVDNCSTNDLMIHYLLDKLSLSSLILGGELFHMRCCAHILNLIVQDGLSVIGEGIERIRESVVFWTGTQKRVEKFEEAARHLAIDCSKKLPLDCKTRWNSTYLMLKVAILYKEVFKRLKQRETQYKTLPTERDWELGSSICDKLSLFYELTLMFSGTKYPTANVFFPSICEIKSSLGIWKEDRDPMIKMMAEKMIVKFDKYWSVIHGVMGVAAVLDPRYKLKAMEFAFPKIYGYEKSESAIIKLKELVYRLFQDYESYSQGTSRDDGVRSSQNNAGGGRFFNEYFTFVEEDNHSGVTMELDLYLQEKVWIKETEIDLLAWWKTNGVKYPRLQKIARDILAIPISTVASESAFSTSGRLVSPHRSRLHPKTLEALMCAQSWLLNEIKEDDTKKAKHIAEAVAAGAKVDRKVYRIRNSELAKAAGVECADMQQIHKASKATIGLIADPESERNFHSFVDILGTEEQVKMAEELILDIVLKTYQGPVFPVILMPPTVYGHTIRLTVGQVARLVGVNGQNALALEVVSGAWLQMTDQPPPGGPNNERIVYIYGPRTNVVRAVSLIHSQVFEPGESPEAEEDMDLLFKELSFTEMMEGMKSRTTELVGFLSAGSTSGSGSASGSGQTEDQKEKNEVDVKDKEESEGEKDVKEEAPSVDQLD